MLYTYSELRKLYRNFSHLSSDKLFILLELARPWERDSGTMEVLENITRHCDARLRSSQ